MVQEVNIEEVFANFEQVKENTVSRINEFLDNPNEEFDEKVKHFLKACKLNLYPVKPYYKHFDGVDWNKSSLHNDFYCDKYATFTFLDLLDYIHDKSTAIVDSKQAIQWFLDNKIAGFVNDW